VRAQQHNPDANAFRLSDRCLVPVLHTRKQRGVPGSEATEQLLGPELTCSCETDIFQALGLHYVPPHMRDLV
jgi:hypothetical protein